MTTSPAQSGHTSWAVSIAFWLCLFVAGFAYAGVALAPKVVAWLALEHEHRTRQFDLVSLDRRNQHLERVVAALESDPHFAEQLVRANLDAQRRGEERIAVDESLHLEAGPTAQEVAPEPPPWYLPQARVLATNASLRRRLLAGAAVAVVLAFAILHDANGPVLRRLARGLCGGTARMLSRYRNDG